MSYKEAYLKNTDGNHNKFYEMIQNRDTHFTSRWGRIGIIDECSYQKMIQLLDDGIYQEKSSSKIYPMTDWDKIYNSKINKGYSIVHKDGVIHRRALHKFLSLRNKIKSSSHMEKFWGNKYKDDQEWVSHIVYEIKSKGLLPYSKKEFNRANELWERYSRCSKNNIVEAII